MAVAILLQRLRDKFVAGLIAIEQGRRAGLVDVRHPAIDLDRERDRLFFGHQRIARFGPEHGNARLTGELPLIKGQEGALH